MKGFIIDATYRIIDNQSFIFLFGRLENNQSFLVMTKYEPYFYIKLIDIKKLPKSVRYEKTFYKNFKDEPVVRILLDSPKEVSLLRNELEENNIECYEADIRFTQRYLIDKNIKSTINIEGDFQLGEFTDRIYQESEITSIEFKPELKTFSIDVETDMEGKKLYSIAIYSRDYKKVLLISKKPVKNAEIFDSEEDLLERFKKIIIEEDPDILTGWNFIDFDLNYLKNLFRKHKISFILGRINHPCRINIEKDFFRTSKASIPGRMVLDALSLLRESPINLSDYKLETAAQKLLNEGKLTTDHKQVNEWFKKDKEKLFDYNLKDAELVYNILEKSSILKLTILRSLLTGMPLDKVSASIASFDSLYLRELKKLQIVAPTSKFEEKTAPLKGGYVKESIPGIYDNVIILDFKSLYPSITRTFNIDPLSYLGSKKQKDSIRTPNNVYFKREQGILPKILEDLWKARDEIKKQNDKIASFAIKTLMASFLGVLGNPSCRFFNPDINNSVTQSGQFFIKHTEDLLTKKGYKVIYEDTDSVFIVSQLKSIEEAEKLGKKLEKEINEYFLAYIKKEFDVKSYLELEFEKIYVRFLMPKLRSSEIGAKKRYAGLTKDDKIEFTGLEFVRGDWTQLAKKFQYELLDRIFHKKEVSEFIKKFVQDTKQGKYDSLLIYRKSIRKDLVEYVKITPPHVKAARKLEKMDSNVIEYLITIDGPEPIQNIKNKINYEHYIQKQIKPIADSVLSFFNTNFEELLKGSKQSTLFSFDKTH